MARYEFETLAALSTEDLSLMLSLPPVLLDLTASPYEDGEAYVAFRTDAEGEEVIEELFADPPQSSEQILHPEDQYQPIVPVDAPPAGGVVTSDGKIGELLLSLWLGQEAAAGWGGDSFVTWSEESTACMTVDIAADSPQDLAQLESSASRWASQTASGARDVEVVDTAATSLVRITGCYNS